MPEIAISFEEMARRIASDAKIRRAMQRGDVLVAHDKIMQHMNSWTISDLLRECVESSDVDEVQMLLDEMKDEG